MKKILSINQIVKKHPDQILYRHCDEVSLSSEDQFDINKIVSDMKTIIISTGAIGLACNQIGISKRIYLSNVNDLVKIYVNPIIISSSKKLTEDIEGCLSIPGCYLKIKRFQTIELQYLLPSGEVITEIQPDLLARVSQHEIDHLNGITMLQRPKGLIDDEFML